MLDSAGSGNSGTDGPRAGQAGSHGGAAATGDPGAYVLGKGEPPACPDDFPGGRICEHQIVLPNGVDFTDPGGPAGAGGAGASGCEFPVLYDPLRFTGPLPDEYVLGEVNLAVDCEFVPYGLTDPGEESYEFPDPETRTTIRLSAALCSRVTRDGFERIDVFPDCDY